MLSDKTSTLEFCKTSLKDCNDLRTASASFSWIGLQSSFSQLSPTTVAPFSFLTDAQNLNPDALVYNSVLLWNSVLHLEHPDQLSKTLQYASSSFNESETFALLLFRWQAEIAELIFIQKSFQPGTAKHREIHFPQNLCIVLKSTLLIDRTDKDIRQRSDRINWIPSGLL